MNILKKLEKLFEAINTYYSFALLVYGAALYITSHSTIFIWLLIVGIPILAAWGGYLFREVVEQRTQRYGFKTTSIVMTYEIGPKGDYLFRYTIKLQAEADHLMVYPIGYQWTGGGIEDAPKLLQEGQQLLVPSGRHQKKKTAPYKAMPVSTEGSWHYWFVAFNPPVHKGDDVEIKYSQSFHDKSGTAKPYLRYFVRTSMKKLVLNVKFPTGFHPKSVSGRYVKLTDPNRPYKKPGVVYDIDKQWATWIINKPKRGYFYGIEWQ